MAANAGNYDDFAVIYNRHWGPRYAAAALETLDALLFSRIPSGARILDLCCGAGHISRILADRGFDVIGLDASASLVTLARSNSPSASFEVADAKNFAVQKPCRAVICLNDSLNHLLTLEDLRSAFLSIYQCMLAGGVLLFDLNLAQKYDMHWAGSFCIVDDDAVCAGVTSTDKQQRLARFDAAIFNRDDDTWKRKDVHLLQTWFASDDVKASLASLGFVDIRVTDRKGATLENYHVDKAFFTCTRK